VSTETYPTGRPGASSVQNSFSDQKQTESVTRGTVEATAGGKWMTVPALIFGDKAVIVRGKLPSMAVVHEEAWLESELENPAECINALRAERHGALHADVFTFGQKLPAVSPKYTYPMELESVAAIRLTTFKEWWEGVPQETRKNVRRSQKRGVEVRVVPMSDSLLHSIREVHDDSPFRQGEPNAHYGKTFERIKKDHSAFLDRSDFIGAYAGEEMVGFVKIVYRGGIASILNIVPKASHQDKRPANALIAKAVELCEARGISHIIYGGYAYGNKKDSSLLEFKRRNGFEEVMVPRYYVPLTPWGELCLELGLHRGVVGIVPYPILQFGVRARTRWYNLTHQMGRRSSIAEQPNRIRQTERSNPPAGSNA
jgi:hypothetical protein